MRRVSRSVRRRVTPRWHQAFLAMMPAIVNSCSRQLQHLDPDAREEAVQEVLANAMVAYVRLVQLKKIDLAYPTSWPATAVAQVRPPQGGRAS